MCLNKGFICSIICLVLVVRELLILLSFVGIRRHIVRAVWDRQMLSFSVEFLSSAISA